MAALARVDDRHATDVALYDRWSVRDLLAHLGWWERRAVDLYHYSTEGTPLVPPLGSMSEGEYNEMILAQYQNASVADVRDMELSAYADLVGIGETAPEEALFSPDRFSWTEGQPFWPWIAGNTYEHYAEHVAGLLEWLAARAGGRA